MFQKRVSLILAIALSVNLLQAQTLFTYGNNTVSKKEFLAAFNKNPDTSGDKNEKLRQYLDLYINFKLKTQAARDEKLDQKPEFKSEVTEFKNQLIDNYINQQANISELIQEAFNRSQKDLRISQVFVEFKGNDTAASYKSIHEAFDKLKNGADFGEVSTAYSTDPALAATKGDIGYITVFTLPYPIENIVYQLQPGSYSEIYKSAIGYHIFKTVAERPALGIRKVQQILFTVPASFSEAEKQKVASLADSVYDRLMKGDSFDKMVAYFGVPTSNYGGDQNVLEVSVGQYEPDFEQQVFTLQNKGDISKPFLTGYGYNILKLIEKIPVVTDPGDVVNRAKLQTSVQEDGRLSRAKDQLLKKWMEEGGFKPGKFSSNDLFHYTDSTFKAGKQIAELNGMTPESVLFSFKSQNFTVKDWFTFFTTSRQQGASFLNGTFGDLYNEFKKDAARQYFRGHIEEFYPPIAEQVVEFKEANLLFSVMDKHVWGKAASDSTGLKKYYAQNKSKYKWQPGLSVLMVSASTPDILDSIGKAVKNDPSRWREIIAGYNQLVMADSSHLEDGQIPYPKEVKKEKGFLSEVIGNKDQDGYSVVYVFEVYPEPSVRSFEDARGMVINDYQQVLEQKWIEQLRKKYPVKVNEPEVKSML